jgi:hypothetical protein
MSQIRVTVPGGTLLHTARTRLLRLLPSPWTPHRLLRGEISRRATARAARRLQLTRSSRMIRARATMAAKASLPSTM